jgi:hypothetical protein
MTFSPNDVAEGLEGTTEEIEDFGGDDDKTVEKYQEALREAVSMGSAEVRSAIAGEKYPGGLPTEEFDEDGAIIRFSASENWESHEDVNDWAEEKLQGVTTVGVDGSNLGPIDEFTVPLGLTQVAWCENEHLRGSKYNEGVKTRVLGPLEVTEEGNESGTRYPDEQAPNHERYADEAQVVVDRIESHSDEEPTPVVFYDGPLVPSFANVFDQEVRQMYFDAMSEVLAASEHHGVPVIGYTAYSGEADIAKMLRWTFPNEIREFDFVKDARILDSFTEAWGDRSPIYVNRHGGTVDELSCTYDGKEYSFEDQMTFAYLNSSGSDVWGMDRIEMPAWIVNEGLTEHVLNVVRAEAGVGRGYPETLQQADANAVLDTSDKREFMGLVQRFAQENDLPIEWDMKSLSKQRRRR